MLVAATAPALVDGEELVDGKLVVLAEVELGSCVELEMVELGSCFVCVELFGLGSCVVDSLGAMREVVTSFPSPQGG